MFDKKKFGEIIKRINDSYATQHDFADKSGVNRTYISQYINNKLDSPPKPEILKKIAENSNGITTYEELMNICGFYEQTKEYNLLLNGDLKYVNLLFGNNNKKMTISDKIKEINRLIDNLRNYKYSCNLILNNVLDSPIQKDSIRNYEMEITRTQKEIEGLELIVYKLKKQLEEK